MDDYLEIPGPRMVACPTCKKELAPSARWCPSCGDADLKFDKVVSRTTFYKDCRYCHATGQVTRQKRSLMIFWISCQEQCTTCDGSGQAEWSEDTFGNGRRIQYRVKYMQDLRSHLE